MDSLIINSTILFLFSIYVVLKIYSQKSCNGGGSSSNSNNSNNNDKSTSGVQKVLFWFALISILLPFLILMFYNKVRPYSLQINLFMLLWIIILFVLVFNNKDCKPDNATIFVSTTSLLLILATNLIDLSKKFQPSFYNKVKSNFLTTSSKVGEQFSNLNQNRKLFREYNV